LERAMLTGCFRIPVPLLYSCLSWLFNNCAREIIDTRRFYSSWELPKGITLDIPEYELIEIIKRGETETVEFKEDVGKPEEFVESAAAFANAKGGLIILGVDDHSNIKGLEKRDYEGIVNNIIRSRCETQVDYEVERRQVEEKELMIIRIHEGKDKPYTIRERGVYIRANATDRIATRFELDKFYENKHSRIIAY
jgi:predicted HTH transcriptional regulator